MEEFSINEIARFRDDTPGCSHVVHLNSAGSSLMPQPVINAIQEHIKLEGDVGGYEASGLMEEQQSGFYAAAGRLLNTKAQNIAYTANATDAYTRALSSV